MPKSSEFKKTFVIFVGVICFAPCMSVSAETVEISESSSVTGPTGLTSYSSVTGAMSNRPSFETVIKLDSFKSSSRVIIDQEFLEAAQNTDLAEVLATQANIHIVKDPFQPNLIYIRGQDPSHLLILVDGVPVYDSTTAQRSFNLAGLNFRSIRRIEVLKGPQTVLYGGQALGAVVLISTLNNSNQRFSQIAIGNRDQKEFSIGATRKYKKGYYWSWAGHFNQRESLSPKLDSDVTYRSGNHGAEIALGKHEGRHDWLLKYFYLRSGAEIPFRNEVSNLVLDAKDFISDSNLQGLSLSTELKTTLWRPNLLIYYQWSDRKFNWPINSTNKSLQDQRYLGVLQGVRIEVTPVETSKFQWLWGGSHTRELFRFRNLGDEIRDAALEKNALFTKLDYQWIPDFSFHSGVRVEEFSDLDKRSINYQLGLSWLQWKTEVASGFRAPSAFQLYAFKYGNPDLRPEQSWHVSLSYEQEYFERIRTSFTFFYTNVKDLIQISGPVSALQYSNVEETRSQGLEWASEFKINPRHRFELLVGYQEPINLKTGERLVRRPYHNGNLRHYYQFSRFYNLIELVTVGDRLDAGFLPQSRQKIDAYEVVNWTLGLRQPGYRNSDRIHDFYLRAHNIFNRRYEQSFSSHAEGISWMVGIHSTY